MFTLHERAKLLFKVAVPFCIPRTMYDKSTCFTYSPEHIVDHFHFTNSSEYTGEFHYVLACISLMTNDDEGFYMFSLSVGTSSLVVFIQIFFYSKLGYVFKVEF